MKFKNDVTVVFTSKVFWSHRDSVLSITFPHNDVLSVSLSVLYFRLSDQL